MVEKVKRISIFSSVICVPTHFISACFRGTFMCTDLFEILANEFHYNKGKEKS